MKRRYVQVDGELVEVSADAVVSPRGGGKSGDSALWNDRLYQDGGDSRFSSRSQHREYMKQRGLTTADDFTEQWRQDEARRIDYRQTGRDPTRKQAIIEAIQQLENTRR